MANALFLTKGLGSPGERSCQLGFMSQKSLSVSNDRLPLHHRLLNDPDSVSCSP